MDVAFILDKYFKGRENISIDVFDAQTQYDDQLKVLRILIADDGMGIRESLAENEKYKDITEPMPQRNITKHLLKQENWNRYGRIQIYRLRNGFWNPRHGTETS